MNILNTVPAGNSFHLLCYNAVFDYIAYLFIGPMRNILVIFCLHGNVIHLSQGINCCHLQDLVDKEL